MSAITNQNILKTTFSFLDPTSFIAANFVCKHWNLAGKADHLWKNFCERDGLFHQLPLHLNETWKQRFELIHRWRKGACIQEAYYRIGTDNVSVDQNVYKVITRENEATFLNLETLEEFTLVVPNGEKVLAAKAFWTYFLLRSEENYHIFDRENRQFIKSVQIDNNELQFGLSENIMGFNVINDNRYRCVNYSKDFFVGNKLFRMNQETLEYSLSGLWMAIPNSGPLRDARHRILHSDESRLIEISYDPNHFHKGILLRIWNWNDLNQEPIIKFLPKPYKYWESGQILAFNQILNMFRSFRVVQNLLIFEGRYSVCAWDINSGQFLFEKKFDGRIKYFYVDKNRILAHTSKGLFNEESEEGIVIFDFNFSTTLNNYAKEAIPTMQNKEVKKRYIIEYGMKLINLVVTISVVIFILFFVKNFKFSPELNLLSRTYKKLIPLG